MRNLKKILALALALVMTLSVMTVANAAYTDSSSIDATYNEAVEVLSGMGVFKGTGTGATFSPKQSITRAEVAAIIYRIVTGDVTDKQVGIYADYARFNDVKATAWYAGYVGYCSNANLIKGDGKGNFLPTATVTGYQALAMILRAVGYDVNGEFTGAGWQVKVASTAQSLGILKNVNSGTLGVAATREVVAELLFQTVAYVPTVTYTPALGYNQYKTLLGFNNVLNDTLGKKTFGLTRVDNGSDAFYRPSYSWTNGGKVVYATFNYEALATFYTAVSQCDVSKALNKSSTWTAEYRENGGAAQTVNLVPTNTVATIGGQGTLTQVYYGPFGANGANTYRITSITTWLAKVTNVTAAKYDVAGHEITPAKTSLEVYDTAGTITNWSYESADFTRGQYVLVTYSWKANEAGVQTIVVAEPVATAALTSFTKATTTVGSTYNNAAKFVLGKPATLADVNKTYNVYVDAYGNVIGLTVPATAYNYGIITDIAWQNSWGLADEYILANLVGMDGQPVSNVTIGNKWTNAGYSNGTFTAINNASVGYNKSGNTAFYGHLFQFTVNAAGQYVATAVGSDAATVAIVNSNPYITHSNGRLIANDDTVYLVKTLVNGQATYTTYTGYKTVPSLKNASACFVLNSTGAYVQYIYVDATGASFSGSGELAVITDDTIDSWGAVYGYNMFVGAEAVLKNVADRKTLAQVGYTTAGLYYVSYDAAGNITGLTHVLCNGQDTVVKTGSIVATYNDGTVIRDAAGTAYNCTGAPVYLGNLAAGYVVEGNAAATVGQTCYLILDAQNVVTAIYIWVG